MNQQAEITEKTLEEDLETLEEGAIPVTPQSNDLFLEIQFPDRIQADVSHFNAFH